MQYNFIDTLAGAQLRQLRRRADLTQTQVADALGYTSPQCICNWERGVSLPPAHALEKLAEIYVTTREHLVNIVVDAYVLAAKNKIEGLYAKG